MGIAEALKRTSKDNVVSVMFGDGALEEGCVVESLNISSVFKLPVVFILEDNGLAIHTTKSPRTGLSDYCRLPDSYGIKSFSASFKDPVSLFQTFEEAFTYSRKERLPSFIQIKCYRWLEHVGVSEDWNLGYRKKEELEQQYKLKLKELKEEEQLEKKRIKDIKLFLRKEQAIIRKEQAEKQRKFLEEIKLEQKIDKFRIREVKELERLERISLKEQREDYVGLQERIDKLKEKYKLIRDQKIRERVEALGVKVRDGDDRETLLNKEREYYISRQKIELALESFYRSANSLVFQLNKRHITKNMSILRCIDRRFETGEIFIKWDESIDEEWLILIYIKDNSPNEGIVIEDKSNSEKNSSYEFKSSDIFKASDLMVDSLTQLISKKREKKLN